MRQPFSTGRLLAALLLFGAQAAARDLPLIQPIDCSLGETCYIQNVVDHDTSDAASDFACGTLAYDGHKGTDFALFTLADMERGVDVLAAAPGTVRAVRDEMPDIRFDDPNAPNLEGRDCGNGLVISHGDGWETQYCHMKRGSLRVAVGERVVAGSVLGHVGLSGRTMFPHLHLTVRRDGATVDPFDPDGNITCAAPDTAPLWTDPIDAPQGGLIDVGFSTAIPDYDAIKAGTAEEAITSRSPAIVFWAYGFGSRPGDTLSLFIAGPEGTLFEQDIVMTRQQALYFRSGGRRIPDSGWAKGTYIATATLSRGHVVLGQLSQRIALD